MVDAVGTTTYDYAAGGQLWTEDLRPQSSGKAGGPWASDTVTNGYWNRLRTSLNLAQPTGKWTSPYRFMYGGVGFVKAVRWP